MKTSENGAEELKEFVQLYLRNVPSAKVNAIAEDACEKVRKLLSDSFRPSADPTLQTKAQYEKDLKKMLRKLEEDVEELLREKINDFVFNRKI